MTAGNPSSEKPGEGKPSAGKPSTGSSPVAAGWPAPTDLAAELLRVRDLRILAGETELVHGVSFSIGRAERVGIIGSSGSGKTLTALAVAGLLPAELRASGSIRLAGAGLDLIGAPERRLAALRGLRIGMVFQEPMTALNPTMTVGRQVGEVMRRHRTVARRSIPARVGELLVETGLPEPDRIARSYPHQLSGGQRQRIVLAIALANRPDLLLCDEPTTALDVSVQARVLELIETRSAAAGAAVLFISHDLAVVASICDRILVMLGGEIVEAGPTVEVLTRPRHPHTRALLAGADLVEPRR